jgi:hypothetical protein
LVVTQDVVLAAAFVLIEPELHAGAIEALPGETVALPLWIEEGKIPYGGLHAALRLPPGVHLQSYAERANLPESFRLDVRRRTWIDGSEIAGIAVFGPEGSLSNRTSDVAVLYVTVERDAIGGHYDLEWMDTHVWAAGTQAVMSDTNGTERVVPTRVNGSITIQREHLVQAALRIRTTPSSTDRMADADFRAYPSRTEFRTNELFTVELWARYHGNEAIGLRGAKWDLEIAGQPVNLLHIQHSAIFSQHTSGTISGQEILALGGSAGSGSEARDAWVRIGWVEAQTTLTTGVTAWATTFVPGHCILSNEERVEDSDMWPINNPLLMRTQTQWATTAQGTPHWWLEEQGLLAALEGHYEAAEASDFDADGMTAREEFIAGTNPNNANSFMQAGDLVRMGASIHFAWDAVAGRTYRIWISTNMLHGDWAPYSPALPSDINQRMNYSTHALPSRAIFRMECELSP